MASHGGEDADWQSIAWPDGNGPFGLSSIMAAPLPPIPPPPPPVANSQDDTANDTPLVAGLTNADDQPEGSVETAVAATGVDATH